MSPWGGRGAGRRWGGWSLGKKIIAKQVAKGGLIGSGF